MNLMTCGSYDYDRVYCDTYDIDSVAGMYALCKLVRVKKCSHYNKRIDKASVDDQCVAFIGVCPTESEILVFTKAGVRVWVFFNSPYVEKYIEKYNDSELVTVCNTQINGLCTTVWIIISKLHDLIQPVPYILEMIGNCASGAEDLNARCIYYWFGQHHFRPGQVETNMDNLNTVSDKFSDTTSGLLYKRQAIEFGTYAYKVKKNVLSQTKYLHTRYGKYKLALVNGNTIHTKDIADIVCDCLNIDGAVVYEWTGNDWMVDICSRKLNYINIAHKYNGIVYQDVARLFMSVEELGKLFPEYTEI